MSGGPVCPECGTEVQPDWDWCEACGYDPEGLKPAAPADPAGDERKGRRRRGKDKDAAKDAGKAKVKVKAKGPVAVVPTPAPSPYDLAPIGVSAPISAMPGSDAVAAGPALPPPPREFDPEDPYDLPWAREDLDPAVHGDPDNDSGALRRFLKR